MNKTREAIKQALQEANNSETSELDSGEEVVTETSTEENTEATTETTEDTEQPSETASPETQISSVQPDGAQAVEPPQETIDAPSSWTRESKDLFKTLPPAVQKELSDREVNQQRYFTRRAQEISNRERVVNEVEEAVSPYRESLQNFGITPGQAFSSLMQAQAHLDADPVSGVMHILQSYGLGLEDFVSQAQNYQQSPSYNPQLVRLESELSQMRSIITDQQKQQAQAEKQALVSMVDSWAYATDANGNPSFPLIQDRHFSEEMGDQIRLLRQRGGHQSLDKLLEEAYKRTASFFNVPQSVVNKDVSKMSKIAKAKKAGKSLSSSGGSEEGPRKFKNTREAAEAAINDAMK